MLLLYSNLMTNLFALTGLKTILLRSLVVAYFFGPPCKLATEFGLMCVTRLRNDL